MSNGRTISTVLILLGILAVLLAVIGGVRFYSPVPYQDMWDGSVNFFLQVSSGNSAVWWEQHNEHRILLPRLLIWLDYAVFGGVGKLPIVATYVLLLLNFLLFSRILLERVGEGARTASTVAMLALLAFFSFLWTQKSNLIWPFQTAFVLVHTLPLLALYSLQRPNNSVPSFLLACMLGVMSAATLANGVLALPILLVYSVLTRQAGSRIAVLIALSLACCYFYFYDYRSPGHHGSPLQQLTEHPLDVLHYALVYLGSPVHALIGKGSVGLAGAAVCGFLMFVGSLYYLKKALGSRADNRVILALLCFILFIASTAVLTATGRLVFGVEQAASERYTTPALMAWSALLVLLAPKVVTTFGNTISKGFKIPLFFLILLMLVVQIKVFRSVKDVNSAREQAALALELGVNDEQSLFVLHPKIDRLRTIAAKASAENISIFAFYPYKDQRERLGTILQRDAPSKRCEPSTLKVEALVKDSEFHRINFIAKSAPEKRGVKRLLIVSNGNRIVGMALSFISKREKTPLDHSSFRGYVISDYDSAALSFVDDLSGCYGALILE